MIKGRPCYSQFPRRHFEDIRDQCAVLTRHELDLVILGQIMGNIFNEDAVGIRSRHALTPRQRSRVVFYHHGFRICKRTFLQLHGVGKNNKYIIIMESTCNTIGKCRFLALKAHYIVCGLTTRDHGNKHRLPHNSMSFEDTKNVVRFLQSHAEDHAILLPGRIPGYKRDDLQLLPSSTTKRVLLIIINYYLYTLPY